MAKIITEKFAFTQYTDGIEFNGKAVATAFDLPPVPAFQGTVSGYASGGGPVVNTIDKFPFASNANATDVGDLTQARQGPSGQSSTESGYTSGGRLAAPANTIVKTIDKFPFASNANATGVGDLFLQTVFGAGQSSTTSGYNSGGLYFNNPRNEINKFSFASNANATDAGDLSQARYFVSGQSSDVSGYSSGGGLPVVNTIDKFPFASNANATDVGDLTQGRYVAAGQSSTDFGYASGGQFTPTSPSITNLIDRFPFASNANATDVGDLTVLRTASSGQSSNVSGYTSSGQTTTVINVIDKFPFASNANATDVGDLTQSRSSPAGQQV